MVGLCAIPASLTLARMSFASALSSPKSAAQNGPVHHMISLEAGSTETKQLLATLRRQPDCLSVKVLLGEDQKTTLWQEWSHSDACTAFWSAQKQENAGNILQRLAL